MPLAPIPSPKICLKGLLVAGIFVLLSFILPPKLSGQNVETDSTEWVGEWRDQGNLQYGFNLKLFPAGDGKFSGVFEWKLIWTSLAEHRPKVGAIAKEYVIGRYDAVQKSFNLIGIRQDDPADIISMDHYMINLSADGRRLEGINVKPENYHGSMFGVKLPRKKPVAIAAAKPKTDSQSAAKVSPNPADKPATNAKTPAVAVAAQPKAMEPAVAPVKLPESSIKEISSREVISKTEMHCTEDKVKIKIFDDSLIDGDILSLSLNGKWILRYYRIEKTPKELIVDLQPGENTLVMFAENLGKYPPNTASITVQQGSKVKNLILNSDMRSSEAITIFRD